MWLRQLQTRRFVAALTAFTLTFTVYAAKELARTNYELERDAREASVLMLEADPTLYQLMDSSVAHTVFANVGKAGVGIGGARGNGVLYEKCRFANGEVARDDQGWPLWKAVGYCKLTQATIGPQIGAQKYHELIFFENQSTLNAFKEGNTEFAAQASAILVTKGAAANAKYEDGVVVFSLPQSGAMIEASIGGQKFSYQPLNPEPLRDRGSESVR